MAKTDELLENKVMELSNLIADSKHDMTPTELREVLETITDAYILHYRQKTPIILDTPQDIIYGCIGVLEALKYKIEHETR